MRSTLFKAMALVAVTVALVPSLANARHWHHHHWHHHHHHM
jgi:hypothetical protein